MDRRTILILASAVAAIVVIAALVAMSGGMGGLGGSNNEIKLVDYEVSAGDISPELTLTFSQKLDEFNTIELLDRDYRTVGTWVYTGGPLGESAKIERIDPPNLIGTYYVVLKWKGDVVLNRSIYFKEPSLTIVDYHLKIDRKGDTAYLEFVNLTLSEEGDSPYYYNRIRWTLDGQERNEKIPMEHFSVGENREISVPTASFVDPGQHTLVLHLDYFDLYTVTVVLHFTV